MERCGLLDQEARKEKLKDFIKSWKEEKE